MEGLYLNKSIYQEYDKKFGIFIIQIKRSQNDEKVHDTIVQEKCVIHFCKICLTQGDHFYTFLPQKYKQNFS